MVPVGDLGLHPLQSPAPRPDFLLRAPRQRPGHGRTVARPFHPRQGQSARPAPSQLLPVTPLGKLGAATAADTLQTPFYCFSPQFPTPEPTWLCRSSPASGIPQETPSPWEEPGRGSKASGVTEIFPISSFETPSMKMCKMCELTPKSSCFREGNGLDLHPLFCSWGGHSTPSTGTVVGTSSCPHWGHLIRLYPIGLGYFGGHQAEGQHGGSSVWNCR